MGFNPCEDCPQLYKEEDPCETCRLDMAETRIGELEARHNTIVEEVRGWRAHFDSRGKGGQTCGDTHPYISRYHLEDIERLVGEEQGKYTYEYYQQMQDKINALEKQLAEKR